MSQLSHWADVGLVEEALRRSVDQAISLATGGGSDGCALCKGTSFQERITRGGAHTRCAYELARMESAVAVRDYLFDPGSMPATLAGVVTDPRIGEWRKGVTNHD